MLSQLHLKNWRSIREATINFTPLTVLIGANSSGKSNILDALHFSKRGFDVGLKVAARNWGGQSQIYPMFAAPNEDVALNLRFLPTTEFGTVEQKLRLHFDDTAVSIASSIIANDQEYVFPENVSNRGVSFNQNGVDDLLITQRMSNWIGNQLTDRWQLLREGFMSKTELFANLEETEPHILSDGAENLPAVLHYIRTTAPLVYENFAADAAWLLDHVTSIETERDEYRTSFSIREKQNVKVDAPSVSTGTRRALAMLAANYVLDVENAEQPGLVVIEEPEQALHPLLLDKFVELLRIYVDHDTNGNKDRQFILTTHNPAFLDYFKREEVRVVNRDPETGETTVDTIPEYLDETWLDERSLGTAWTNRLVGGVPEP